ncbi:MAG: trimethylamine methyltransferase family protein [Anaerolineales bacterium]|jgi:trimethylamine--corrinoid protein Co-methyltransferase
MKTGARGGALTVIPEEDVERIYRASLDLLMDPGIFSESDIYLDLFEKGGAKVNRSERTIQLPQDLIEWAIQMAPKAFTLYGRNDPAMDLQIELGHTYFGMGGTSEPLVWDYDQRKSRQPTKQDMINNTRIGQALSDIDFVQTLCMSGDQQTDMIFYHDFDAIFRNTTKPTVLNILERPFTQHLLEMAAAVSGGEEALRLKPSMLGIATPVSPLKIPIMNEGIIDAVNAGVPILYSPGPLMGATGPATVAGLVTLANAEVLFGVTLVQLIKQGAPVVLKPDTDVFDMKTTQVTYGSPEQNLGKIAMVQLAKRYHLPIYGLGGGVEGKMPDAEAAAEAMQSMLLDGLAGMTMCQSLGSLAFGMYGSSEMAVLCDEMVRIVKRVLQGFDVNEETLALDVIRKCGYGGSYLAQPHTRRNYRKEMYFPALFQRQTSDEWIKAGSKDIYEVAHEKVLGLLEQSQPVKLLPGADAELERALQHAVAR